MTESGFAQAIACQEPWRQYVHWCTSKASKLEIYLEPLSFPHEPVQVRGHEDVERLHIRVCVWQRKREGLHRYRQVVVSDAPVAVLLVRSIVI